MRWLKYFLCFLTALCVAFFLFFFVGAPPPAAHQTWGASFSQKYAKDLGLDWRQVYLALLDDLKVKHIRISVHWDLVEPAPGTFRFDDLDWQIAQAARRNVQVIPVVGMKTPRWPECHLPGWVRSKSATDRQAEVMKLLDKVVTRYGKEPAITAWQVENEPFVAFGDCPAPDRNFFLKEVEEVKKLAPNRPVWVTTSGEWSLGADVADAGDVFGTTLYRKVFYDPLHIYVSYPFPPVFYARKAWLMDKFFHKPTVVAELQAEPWGPKAISEMDAAERSKTMTPEKFREIISFARHTGLDQFYLWGGEWWYYAKLHGEPEFWAEAKQLFAGILVK